jgi:hypothetical protein
MARPASRHPTELELQILKLLWQHSPRLARDVQTALAGEGRALARTSVITTLNTISADGRFVAAGDRDLIAVWDVASGQMRKKAALQPRRVDALAFSPDGQRLVISDPNDMIFWNWQTDEQPTTIHVGRTIISLAFSNDGNYLAEGPDSRADIQIRDLRTLDVVQALRDGDGSPLMTFGLEFSDDGRTLTAGNAITVDESKLKIPYRLLTWNVESGAVLRRIAFPEVLPMNVAVSPSGQFLAARLETTENNDSFVAVWSPAAGDGTGPDNPGDKANNGAPPAEPVAPEPVPAEDSNLSVATAAPVICGLSLAGVPSTLNQIVLGDLMEPDPDQPGRMRRVTGVLTMPIYESEPYAILTYPVRLKRFYVELREAGNLRRIYGPIDGDPFEKLNLDASMRAQLRTADGSTSDALLRLLGMLSVGDEPLLARAFAMMDEIPQPQYRYRHTLESLIESADEALPRITDPELLAAARKARLRILALSSTAKIEWERRRVELDDSEYTEGSDEALDPSIVWGTAAENGLQLGLGPNLDSAKWNYGGVPRVNLWVRNTGDAPVRFSSSDRVDEGVRVWLLDADERKFPLGISVFTSPIQIRRYQLGPGQQTLLKSIRFGVSPKIEDDKIAVRPLLRRPGPLRTGNGTADRRVRKLRQGREYHGSGRGRMDGHADGPQSGAHDRDRRMILHRSRPG